MPTDVSIIVMINDQKRSEKDRKLVKIGFQFELEHRFRTTYKGSVIIFRTTYIKYLTYIV